MDIKNIINHAPARQQIMAVGQVTPEAIRCMQCGICSFNCPVDIDVRRYAWLGRSISDSRCLSCGECVARCPRSALRFEIDDLLGDP